jgi:hypothetical protein
MGEACNKHEGDENIQPFCFECLKGRDHSEDLSVDERMTLESISVKSGVRVWTGCNWLKTGTGGGIL